MMIIPSYQHDFHRFPQNIQSIAIVIAITKLPISCLISFATVSFSSFVCYFQTCRQTTETKMIWKPKIIVIINPSTNFPPPPTPFYVITSKIYFLYKILNINTYTYYYIPIIVRSSVSSLLRILCVLCIRTYVHITLSIVITVSAIANEQSKLWAADIPTYLFSLINSNFTHFILYSHLVFSTKW